MYNCNTFTSLTDGISQVSFMLESSSYSGNYAMKMG